MVGFNIQNLKSFNLECICPSCSLLLRDPAQSVNCGHRMCQSCADEKEGEMIMCPTCLEKTAREKLILDRGFKNDMQILWIICSLCSWAGVLKNYPDHLDETHPNPRCLYCEEIFPSINDLNRHQQFLCQKITISCPLQQFGCQTMILRVDLIQHYRSKEHQNILMGIVLHLRSSYQLKLAPRNTTENQIAQLEEVQETANILSSGVAVLDEDVQRLKSESVSEQATLDSLMKDISTSKRSVEEQNGFLNNIMINQESIQQDLVSTRQMVDEMKMRSHDGTFLWRITNIQEKMVAARSTTQTSICSPPFFSSPTGYKLCLQLYPNGDGNARGTYMSLFIIIMRSEYDAILRFPFDFQVIFCLFDQTNQQKHIIVAFRPDTLSSSAQRPRSDMNVGSGIGEFASLKLVEPENNPYIRDDTLFIKIMINFDNMPKTILPYVFSLSPGFTAQMLQTMIDEERKKQYSQVILDSSTAKSEINQLMDVDLHQMDTFQGVNSNKKNEYTNVGEDSD